MSWGVDYLTIRYGGRAALEEVSLDVADSMVTAVVGGDGAGKTTLLRVLVGLRRPDGGSVRRPPADRIGYFSAASGVYPDLTVAENLDFAASAYGTVGPEAKQYQDELLRAAGLESAGDRLGGHLSGGMRQKLGLVMAMVHRPSLLVLDEPSTGVDPISRAGLSWLIGRAAASGTAVVLSTAYLDEAERAAQVLVLDDGRMLACGSPEEIVASVPGRVMTVGSRPDDRRSWRRGTGWRLWVPPGVDAHADGETGSTAELDLEDAVIVASLERSR